MEYVGIDVGRTSVRLAYQDNQGQHRNFTFPTQQSEIPWEKNREVIKRIRQWCEMVDIQLTGETTVVIGAAGAAEYERFWSMGNQRVWLYGDITLAAVSCGVQHSGMLGIYGTGGALVVFRQSSRKILEAFGPVVGDRWGGLALGRMAIRYLLELQILSKERTEYSQALATELGIYSRNEYLDWLRHDPNHPRSLARLGKCTVAFAEQDDSTAVQFCRETIREMVGAILRIQNALNLSGTLRLGIQGSVMEKSQWMRRELEKMLTGTGVRFTLHLPEKPLEDCALDLAIQSVE